MTRQIRTHRRAFAVLLFVLVACMPLVLQRVSASSNEPTITVVGDSITASYNNRVGDARQGWWSMVGRHYGADVTTYAEPGSGYLRRGDDCRGTRFYERPLALLTRSPDVMIIEGGRNDWLDCRRGNYVISSTRAVRRAVNRYLDDVRMVVKPSTRIIVLGPVWGPRDAGHEARIRAIVERAAVAHEMEFVDTSNVLNRARVLDGTHPNRAGSKALARRVMAAIGPQLA
ncbi:MAG: hypothetical protein JWP10_21 [Nocardioidaceae bacterium]|nr:hypothetical protein [Nocardioidaceae bacterium]